jgi:hypothetical protein
VGRVHWQRQGVLDQALPETDSIHSTRFNGTSPPVVINEEECLSWELTASV